MKKASILILILLLTIFLCSCSQKENPEKSVSDALNALKTMDSETARKYIDYNMIIQNANLDNQATKTSNQKIASLMLKNLEYSIISSNVNNDTATVKAKLTNLDITSISNEYSMENLNLTISQSFVSDIDKKTSEDLICELLSKTDNKKVSNTIDIELYKENDTWKIKTTQNLANAILGKTSDLSSFLGSLK